MGFADELKWRGMIHDMMPGVDEELNKGMATAYIGFDPTADSLHIGSLVQIMTLVHFQKAGNKPIALVGGATGMVGDPSGKSKERNLITLDGIEHNLSCVKKQLEQFLDFDCGDNSAEVINNYDWFKEFDFLSFIRDVGKHISVNYMMAKDSVKNRLETGMSFTEFSYQLIQGYDFYHLYKNKNCKIQLGGSDQWGNITTGTELIRRLDGGDAYAITTPLIKKADGSKFGKTEDGNVWLDRNRTSPYKFYQYWINSSDDDVKKYIKIFTLFNKNKIDELINEHEKAPHLRILQKELAKDITIRVHSEEDYKASVEASEVLFGKGTTESLKKMDELTFLSVFEGVPCYDVAYSDIKNNINVLDLLAEKAPIFNSKGELRRLIQGGGVSINKEKVANADLAFTSENLLNNKYLLVQKGKKNYFLIKATD